MRRRGARIHGAVAREHAGRLGGGHGNEHGRRTNLFDEGRLVLVEIGNRHYRSGGRCARRQAARQIAAVGQVEVQTFERREVAP